MPEPAVFLDRDGVINARRPDHVKSWSEFRFVPGSLRALRLLAGMGERIVVVTNQSAVGRGLLTADGLASIHARMTQAVRTAGGRIDAVYACPHVPEARCSCRKPGAGLLLRAGDELGIDLGRSVLVGDSPCDVEAARAARCRPILVDGGGAPAPDPRVPRVPDLLHAVALLREARPERLARDSAARRSRWWSGAEHRSAACLSTGERGAEDPDRQMGRMGVEDPSDFPAAPLEVAAPEGCPC
ncbi:MAG TPA: HAD-IIIA family hydrolase [Candidatus Eisenbacteria bacterium]|nr:HAD-IIIA family hydrolase [Candidatus Eisenbacteria bacterium]